MHNELVAYTLPTRPPRVRASILPRLVRCEEKDGEVSPGDSGRVNGSFDKPIRTAGSGRLFGIERSRGLVMDTSPYPPAKVGRRDAKQQQ